MDTPVSSSAAEVSVTYGRQRWTMRTLENSTAEKVAALLNDGIPQNEIAGLLKITKGAVSKSKKKAVKLDLLNVDSYEFPVSPI
jgi:hypothetical protein